MDELVRLKRRVLELEEENAALKKENEALEKRIRFARGVPAEEFVAKLTDGVRSRYKDGHDVTTGRGRRLEIKMSHLNSPGSSKTRRWNWDRLRGDNETKDYDFLVLVGDKDPRYASQYPSGLEYVCFLIPRGEVDTVCSRGDCIALNTNLNTVRAHKGILLKKYLLHSPACLREL